MRDGAWDGARHPARNAGQGPEARAVTASRAPALELGAGIRHQRLGDDATLARPRARRGGPRRRGGSGSRPPLPPPSARGRVVALPTPGAQPGAWRHSSGRPRAAVRRRTSRRPWCRRRCPGRCASRTREKIISRRGRSGGARWRHAERRPPLREARRDHAGAEQDGDRLPLDGGPSPARFLRSARWPTRERPRPRSGR